MLPRRPRFANRMLLFAAVAAFLLFALPAGTAPPPGDDDRPLVFGVNRIGNPEPIFDPPDYFEHVYQRIQEVGGTLVRILASPRDIERRRGKRDWSDFDKDLGLALKYGQEPMVLVCNIPAWASPTGQECHDYPYKTEMLPDFADFCADLAKRTKGKAKYFQLWNEQNGCGWHVDGGFNRTDEYLPMLLTFYRGIKKGNPKAVALMGSLDDAQGNASIFLRNIYEERQKKAPRQKMFDGITDHPYSFDTRTMRTKLEALREILDENGDKETPIWITEYGWHNDGTPEHERVRRVKAFLAKFIHPDWSYVQGAIYLSIADFECTDVGFGFCDVNLRPRESFYAFQAASRFGALPPSRIRWKPLSGDKVILKWQTVEAATGTIKMTPAPASAIPKGSKLEPSHDIEIDGLSPDTEYEVVISTRSADGKKIDSAPHKFRTPGKEVFNGDFESGFFAGIANGWSIGGPGFCADAGRIPGVSPHGGRHAQAVMSRGGLSLDSGCTALVATKPGQELSLSVWCSGEARDCGVIVRVRVGIDPAAGKDPNAESVAWSEWKDLSKSWCELRAAAKATGTVATVFVHARSSGSAGNGLAYVAFDDVKLKAK